MTTRRVTAGKRLSEAAWDALLEALAVFWWYRPDLERFLRAEFADVPELLARLNFDLSKREVASDAVAYLRRNEERFQGLVIDVLVRLSEFDPTFSRLARLDDGEAKVEKAKAALEDVQTVVAAYGELAAARERIREEVDRQRDEEERRRVREGGLAKLKANFLELYGMENAQERGRQLEGLLNELFDLHELYPRAAYSLEHEQIDGAFTFQTDDYLLEARWWKSPLQPKHLSEFKGKVDSKAKHVLGLLVAVGGFTDGAIEMHSQGTSLILMDGADLYAVLEGRISLTEVLERKRRHAAETGSPMLPVSRMLG